MIKKVKHILAVCCIIVVSITYSQESIMEREAIMLDSLTQQMFQNVMNLDYEGIFSMTHPKVFEIAPKETLREFLAASFEGSGEFKIELFDTTPEYQISTIFNDETSNSKYAFVSYNMDMKMTFIHESFDDNTKEIMQKMMNAEGIDVTFTSDNVLDATVNNSITIVLKNAETHDKWVMVNYDADSPLFYQVVPTSIIEKTKAYKQDLMLNNAKN